MRQDSTPDNAIPFGYCQCGCGRKTTIYPCNLAARGWVKGEPRPFVHGHNRRTNTRAICRHCGASFLVKHTGHDYKFCSHACYAESMSAVSLADRFWPKVDKSPESGCWHWTGAMNPSGHGVLGRGGRNHGAHRVSWQLHHGDIPKEMHVCHHCDNPRCVNPDHLFLGTAADNVADMVRKGRQAKGPRKTPGV